MSVISKVFVRVPATTTNLGPGFDCLGLALGLYNELVLEMHDGPGETAVEITGEGASTLARDKSNLMVKAANIVIGDRIQRRLVFKAKNRIPLARGLGSSAATVVAGLVAANRLLRKPALSREQLFQYAAVLEGHPDNAAAAIYGGLTVCIKENKEFAVFPLKPHAGLCAVAAVPDFELRTADARAVLPQTVLLQDAVENVSRALLLACALERGRWKWLAAAMSDRLHQPYRACLVRGLSDVLQAALKAGACGSALSGSGPSILALCRKGPGAAKIGRAMQNAFLSHGMRSAFLILPIDHKGVVVR